MTNRSRVARALLYFVGALLFTLGLVGMIVSALPPHMIDFLGTSRDQLDPRVSQVLLMLIKLASVLYLAIGATVVIVTRRLLHRDANGSSLILATLLFPFVFIPIIMLPAGFGPPMVYVPVMLACTILALILVRGAEDRHVQPAQQI